MKIRHLTYVAWALLTFGVGTSVFAANEGNAPKELPVNQPQKSILQLAIDRQGDFCKKGMSIFSVSVREGAGNRCVGEMGASIARYVCDGWVNPQNKNDKFEGSQCDQKAQKAGINYKEDAVKYLNSSMGNNQLSIAMNLCRFISDILPDTKNECEIITAEAGPTGAAPNPRITAGRILTALKQYVSNFNKDHAFTAPNEFNHLLKINMDFLPHAMEAELEGKDFWEYSYELNKPKLEKIAGQTKVDAYGQKDFAVVSIGSSSTQVTYLEDGKVKNFQYLFGTSPSPNKSRLLDKMIADLKGLKKPLLLINSIAFARPAGLAKDAKVPEVLPLDGSINFEKDKKGTGELAQTIATKLDKAVPAFISTLGKSDKLVNKWTNSLVKGLKVDGVDVFTEGKIGFVVDYGGGGFSVKLVSGKDFSDDPNYVEVFFPKKGEDGPDFYDQLPVVKSFKDIKDLKAFVPPAELKDSRDLIIKTITTFVEKARAGEKVKSLGNGKVYDLSPYMGNVRSQFAFPVVVRRTGQLRELYDEVKNIVGPTASALLVPRQFTADLLVNKSALNLEAVRPLS